MFVVANAAARVPLAARPVLRSRPSRSSATRPQPRPAASSAASPAAAAGSTVSPTRPGAPTRARTFPRIHRMAVRPCADGWMLLVDDIDEPAWVLPTKRQTVATARDAARFHRCPLDVFRSDDTLQRTFHPDN